MLAEDAGAEDFLERPALEALAKVFEENLGESLIGQKFGSYQILSLLGKGGMGEVYRAQDTNLRREVALKVLPEAFAHDSERLARFRREARLLASLNHPNIAVIYGMEECDGLHCLAMELVPGETLMGAGPLPLEEALTIGRQIAEGLEEAHRKNITHRDIKPSHIKVTPEGVAKILDFGLAKALAWEQPEVDLSKLTITSGVATQDGRILGTPAYMSPEQVRGKAVDKQTDIWAFGCVLYEMLTGRMAFVGDTVSDTIAAVLERDLAWKLLPDKTPRNIQILLQRCLQKDPKRRLRDIGDARLEIEQSLAEGARGAGQPASELREFDLRPSFPRRLIWIIGSVLLVSLVFAGWFFRTRLAYSPARDVQLQRLTDFVGMEESPAVSPDGKTVTFVAQVDGRSQIWIRLLAGGTPLQITKDDADHAEPRWSSDSSSIIYYSPSPTPGEEGAIWEISALGGPPRRLASGLSGGDISHDGRHFAVFQLQDGKIELAVVRRDGSRTEQFKQLADGCVYSHPRWSPDDRWIAFQRGSCGGGVDQAISIAPSSPGGASREIRSGPSDGTIHLRSSIREGQLDQRTRQQRPADSDSSCRRNANLSGRPRRDKLVLTVV